MRPKKLVLSAWGPYPNREEVDFTAFDDRGIFLITGATGAGKTTIFDAISYALYGALSGDERDKERNSVRSDFADPQTPTFVELTMEHGGEIYQIRRNPEYFRPKKKASGLTKEKENAILTYPDGKVIEGVREVNGVLCELLGLDYQQFKKISMIAQGEFARLLVAPPKEKTKIFREIFGTGIYERFTQGLSIRSRRLYAKVAEHKAKLAEDIRLLGVDIRKNGWTEATKEHFETVTAGENWSYDELQDCLNQMEQEALEAVERYKKRYGEADKEVTKQTAALSVQEQINRNIERLKQVSVERDNLLALAEEYREKERRFAQAQNAGFVEGAEEKKVQIQRQLVGNHSQKEQTAQEKQLLHAEAKELHGLLQQEEYIREQVNRKKTLQELQREQEKLRKELSARTKQLKRGQEQYLEKEAVCSQAKADYEEADHRRKLAAIGLAAALLEEGRPCPVCGATEHPAPARVEEKVVSEEELQRLKDRMEVQDAELRKMHENVIGCKTQVDSLMKQDEQLLDKVAQEEKVLAEEQDGLCRSYLELSVEQSLTKLRQQCERAGRLSGLLQEKEAYEKRLELLEKQLSEELKEAEQVLRQMLKQYGFQDMDAYGKAKLSAGERAALQKDIADYGKKLAANKELYMHLQEAVKGKETVDLQEYRRHLQEIRAVRDAALKEQKRWEQNLAEVQKTGKMMREKLALIAEDGNEYGYIKDLENMATGNNAKRLVFEQFVLAGYFEEILRAANLRFRKMTAGRYEMERVSEVGDGRVKDSLEIQVMDYYTGKYRSVRTLSGGESFKASLALALGMSDVIQSMNGGIRVDTLFVDEGFGALDEESLNQACDTLMALVEKNRLIGIISHVPELRERIDRQLIIDKTGSGSTIRNRVE